MASAIMAGLLHRQVSPTECLTLCQNGDERKPTIDIGVRATAEHIADLLVEDLTVDHGKLRTDVVAQLKQLTDDGILMRVGSEYRIQTEEWRAWDDEFRKREPKFKNNAADFDEQRDQLLAAEVDQALKGIKLIQGQAKVSRSLVTYRGQDSLRLAEKRFLFGFATDSLPLKRR